MAYADIGIIDKAITDANIEVEILLFIFKLITPYL